MRDYLDLVRYPRPGGAIAEIVAHLDAGGNPRAHDNTALRWACATGNLTILDRLIAGTPRYPGLTAADARVFHNYALHCACIVGCLAIVVRLLALGLTADDARDWDNDAVRMTCLYGHLDILERLIGLGLTADDARTRDNFALRRACSRGHLAVVERLIELGLTADDARADNNEALQSACANSHLAVVARLLELGVVPTPNALVLCGAGRQVDDDWFQRLWRAVDRWEGSHELQAAESDLTPADLEAWEAAKDRARPSGLRFAD